ncbi:hypothetical protein Tco_1532234 [Tanacetum coccineum]
MTRLMNKELEAKLQLHRQSPGGSNADSGTDSEPLEQVQYDTDDNVFANDIQHFDQSESIIKNTVQWETDYNRVALAKLIILLNLKLDIDENKKIQKQLKKANASLTQELTECKSILAETSRTLGESNNNKHNGPELSPGSHWPRPEYNKTDAERSQTAPANQQRISQRPRKTIRVRSHDNRGPLSDKGLTPATTIISEILEKPSTRLAYKRNPLTLQMLLPIIAEKVHQEKVQQEKLKEVKARLNFEGCSGRNLKIQKVSQHSESRTPNVRGEHGRGRRSGRSHCMSGSPEPTSVFSKIRRGRSESPRHMLEGKGRKEEGVFGRLGGKGKNVSARSESRYQSSRSGRTESAPRKRHYEGTCSRRTKVLSKSEDSGGGYWKTRSKKPKSSIEEDDLSNHGCAKKQIPSHPVYATSIFQKGPGCQVTLKHMTEVKTQRIT